MQILLYILRNFNIFSVCKIFSSFQFWMTEVIHPLFLLTHIPKGARIKTLEFEVPHTWLYKILGIISFYFQKTVSRKKITMDEVIKNNSWKKSKRNISSNELLAQIIQKLFTLSLSVKRQAKKLHFTKPTLWKQTHGWS